MFHLATNGLGLLLLGGTVSRVSGWWRLLVLFLAGGACANLISGAFGHFDLAIGSSSAVYALLGGVAVLVYAVKDSLYAAARRRLLTLLVLVVAVDFLLATQALRIDYIAHLGGFMSGVVLGRAGLCRSRQKLGRIPQADYSPSP